MAQPAKSNYLKYRHINNSPKQDITTHRNIGPCMAPEPKEMSAKSTKVARMAPSNGPAAVAAEARPNKKRKTRNPSGYQAETTESPTEEATMEDPPPPTPRLTSILIPEEAACSENIHPANSPAHSSSIPMLIPPQEETSPSPPPSPSPRNLRSANRSALWSDLVTPNISVDLSRSRVSTPMLGNTTNPDQQATTPTLAGGPGTPPTASPLASLRQTLGIDSNFGGRPNRFRNDIRDPLAKYTNAAMPKVQDAYPSSNFELIHPDIFDEWDTFPDKKLAAIPFGITTRISFNKHAIGSLIFSAVKEITKVETLGVSAPEPNAYASSIQESPITYLISELSDEGRQILLEREVWSAPEIAFRVIPLEPTRPDFLFTIVNLSTMQTDAVRDAVISKWQDKQAQIFFQLIPQDMQLGDTAPPVLDIKGFIASVKITRLNIKEKGDKVKPRFNVYADSSFISTPEVWIQVRDFLAGRNYVSTRIGSGRTIIAPNSCGICHSVDHPRGLCPFLKVPGWNGPFRNFEPQTNGNNGRRQGPPTLPNRRWN